MDNPNTKRLVHLAEDLKSAMEDPDGGFISLSKANAELLNKCLTEYLSGRARTLDDAFGVKRRRGSPSSGPTKKNMSIARAAMYRGNKSWMDVAVETNMEPRTLQRLVKRHGSRINEDIAQRLSQRLARKDSEKKDP